MVAATSGSKSLKEYLKRYESNTEEDKKQKKKKRKVKPETQGVLVVDEDPVWQKQVNLEEEEEDNDSADETKPLVDEDIEVQRMKRLEQIRSRRAYNTIAEDGSGWISLSPKHANHVDQNFDISPPRRERARNDTPSPKPEGKPSNSDREDIDLSPPRQQRSHHHTPSLDWKSLHSGREDTDLSPPRQRRSRHHTPSPDGKSLHSNKNTDLSPPWQQRSRHHTPSPDGKSLHSNKNSDLSPPRQRRSRNYTPLPERKSHSSKKDTDLSPLQRGRSQEHEPNIKPVSNSNLDLSPPRKWRAQNDSAASDISSAPQAPPSRPDLSPPRKSWNESSNERRRTGLISGREIREEISKIKEDDLLRFQQMDPSISGRGAEPIYRDKRGERISKDEFMKSKQKQEEKPKEKKIEWGKGLAQKREAEARVQELELEKEKPFARTRDDPELDEMLKERLRWGDPMAHLVKKKQPEVVLTDLGDDEKMKESGFIIPQDIPSHSWIKRGLDAAPNRYGIKPGRHWDGVDRSNGFEKQLFKRSNEKQATEREAYLWSVSDM